MSLNSAPNAGYSGAIVSMTVDGSPVSLSVISRTAGYGDRTIVWEPALWFAPGQADMRVDVTVSGIAGASDMSYEVIVFDPSVVSDLIFFDGFESGNTSAWSLVVP